LPDERTALGRAEDAEDVSESEDSDDDQMPEPVLPITAPFPNVRQTGARTKQDCQKRAGVARVIKGPGDERAEEGEAPVLPQSGRKAGRIG
jgi:hypothetical protein